MFRFTQEPSSGNWSHFHSTGNAHIKKYSGAIPVILAGHWLQLPDDGSCVNRNMSKQIL